MIKDILLFSIVLSIMSGCFATAESNLPKCNTSFVTSAGCILKVNSCLNPIKSKDDLIRRCDSEENIMNDFQKK
jgi:hypothetical protein